MANSPPFDFPDEFKWIQIQMGTAATSNLRPSQYDPQYKKFLTFSFNLVKIPKVLNPMKEE
jgi:hypothetical protein